MLKKKCQHYSSGPSYNNYDQGAIIVGDYKLIVGPQFDKCSKLMWPPRPRIPFQQGPGFSNAYEYMTEHDCYWSHGMSPLDGI